MPGLELTVLFGDDQVRLDNRTGKTIVIKGYGGEPYLRFGPDGIAVNVNSPAGYLNQDRYGQSIVPKSAASSATELAEARRRRRSGPGTTTGSTT